MTTATVSGEDIKAALERGGKIFDSRELLKKEDFLCPFCRSEKYDPEEDWKCCKGCGVKFLDSEKFMNASNLGEAENGCPACGCNFHHEFYSVTNGIPGRLMRRGMFCFNCSLVLEVFKDPFQ